MYKPLLFSFKVFVFISLEIIFPLCSFAQPFTNEKKIDTSAVNLVSQRQGSIDVSKDGIIGVTWIDETDYWWFMNIALSTDHGESFIKKVVDSSAIFTEVSLYYPRIHFDKSGNIWLTNYYWSYYGGSLRIYIRKSTDGGKTFSKILLGDPGPSTNYSINSDSLGNIYILWEPLGRLTCTKIINGNLNDTIKSVIPHPGLLLDSYPNGITADGGNVFVVFSGGVDPDSDHVYIYKTYFVKSSDGGLTFSSPKQIDTTVSELTYQSDPDIFFWNDRLCIKWKDKRDGKFSIYFTESLDNGGTFKEAVKINNDEDGPVRNSHISGNSSMLGLAWTSELVLQSSLQYDVYFSKKTIQSDTFSVPVRVGNPLYREYSQLEGGIAADKDGYTYIIFHDDRTAPGYYKYRLYLSKAKFDISDAEETTYVPGFYLLQNYPNPFNPNTKINYSVPQTSQVQIKVYDVLGNEIETLVNEEKPAGNYQVEFNADGITSGIYFYTLKAGDFIQTKKMLLLK